MHKPSRGARLGKHRRAAAGPWAEQKHASTPIESIRGQTRPLELPPVGKP